MPNAWTEHVREYAKKNNISYGCAITKAGPSYKSKKGTTATKKTAPQKAVVADNNNETLKILKDVAIMRKKLTEQYTITKIKKNLNRARDSTGEERKNKLKKYVGEIAEDLKNGQEKIFSKMPSRSALLKLPTSDLGFEARDKQNFEKRLKAINRNLQKEVNKILQDKK